MNTCKNTIVWCALVMLCGGCFTTQPPQSAVRVTSTSSLFKTPSPNAGPETLPGIEIFSDGRVVVTRCAGVGLEKKLNAKSLKALLAAIEKAGFFNISKDALPSRSASRNLAVLDANTTVISARFGRLTNHIEIYALRTIVDAYPDNQNYKTLKNCVEMVYQSVGEEPCY